MILHLTRKKTYARNHRMHEHRCQDSIYVNKRLVVRFMVFMATFNNISVISWQSVLLVEETRVPRDNHRPVASH
jgi:hypothetical protein